jgi:site-specific DNA-methyltransferase (adenine-specific)
LRDYNGYSFEFEKMADELLRVTKKGGVVVWVIGLGCLLVVFS